MPDLEDGIKRVLISTIGGAILSAYFNNLAKVDSSFEIIAASITVISIFSVIEIIEKSPYWGIGYTVGYVIGIALIGRMMEPWEKDLLRIVLVLTLIQKVFRKLRKFKL